MTRASKPKSPQLVPAFTVTVDGVPYGPFPEKDKGKFNYLMHKKGVEIKPTNVHPDSLSLSLSLSLLSAKGVSRSTRRFWTASGSPRSTGHGIKASRASVLAVP